MVGVEPLHASFYPTWLVTVAMMMIVIRIMVIVTIQISSEYVDELEGRFCELPADSAALFCYFNSLDLFHRYLDNFKGGFEFPSSTHDIIIVRFLRDPDWSKRRSETLRA